MTDDERSLRELLHRAAEPFEPLDGPAIRAAAERGTRPRVSRALLPVAVAASVVAIAVTSVLISQRNSTSHQAPLTNPTVGHTTTPTSVDPAFQLRLVLPGMSFPADGTPIRAYVLATNHTGRPVVLHNPCNGWVQAGLTGGPASFGITNGLVGCKSETLHQGTTRVPVTIETTYLGCRQGPGAGTYTDPKCLPSGEPNLPPGRYRAVVATQDTSVLPMLPQPQPITLTKAT